LRRALGEAPLEAVGPLDEAAVAGFTTAMDTDFNTPDALAVIFDLAREINRGRDQHVLEAELDTRRRTLLHLLDILGVDLRQSETSRDEAIDPFVELLLATRQKLRAAKQWALSDEIRDGLQALGVAIEDHANEPSTWRRL
jgi:cysteinyl-tRNA synthetase